MEINENRLISKDICIVLLVVLSCALFINYYKPLQMDELSTYFHCSEKTITELNHSNNSGVNMLPPFYFLLNWAADSIIELNIFVLRLIPLLFGLLSILIIKDILSTFFNREAVLFTIISAISHCPIFLFSICEARPYTLYFLLTLLLLKYTIDMKTDYISKRIILLNFLIPSTFYFGGIYCVFIWAFYSMYNFRNKKSFRKYTISCFLGWFLFLIISFPTFIEQTQNTYTLTFKSNNFLSISSLFNYYGMHVYFNISLFSILLLKLGDKDNNIRDINKLFIFIPFFFIPTFIFIISKGLSYNLFQERYFIPSTIYMFVLYGIIIHFFRLYRCNRYIFHLHYIYCFALFSYLTFSYSKSYNLENPEHSLKSISEYPYPVITQSRRIAFLINQQNKRQAFQLVTDQKYAEHMIGFSKKLNPIPLSNFISFTKDKLNSMKKVIYISTPWVNEDIDQVKHLFIENKIKFNEIPCQKSPQVSSIYLLSTKT